MRLAGPFSTLVLAATIGAAAPAPRLDLPPEDAARVRRYERAVEQVASARKAGRNDLVARAQARALGISGVDPGLWYDHACALALTGRPDEAMAALETALDRGWSDPEWPAQDSDLAPLHERADFQDWLARVRGFRWSAPSDVGELAREGSVIAEAVEAAEERIEAAGPLLGSLGARNPRRVVKVWESRSWREVAQGAQSRADREAALTKGLVAIAGDDGWASDGALLHEAALVAELVIDSAPQSEVASAAAVTRARWLADRAGREAAKSPEAAESATDAELARQLLLVAASRSSGKGLERALVESARRVDDVGARALVDRLRAVAGVEGSRELMLRHARGRWYELEGLPRFEVTTLDGRALTHATLPGRVTLLDFWATWCGPCREELPHLKEARERFGARGFEIVGVSLDNAKGGDASAFLAWCNEHGVEWPQVFDGLHWESRLAKDFGVKSIPFPLLVDDEGRVIASDDALRGPGLLDAIERALGGAPTEDERIGN